MKLSAIAQAAQRLVGNMCHARVAAVIGATTTAVTTTGTGFYTIDGVARAVSALTNQALSALAAADLPTAQANWLQPSGLGGAFYVQPANTTAYYVIGLNAAGTVKVVQGLYQGQQVQYPGGLTVIGDGTVPDVPDGFIPITVMKIVSGGSTFTPGTTALTGIATFTDVTVLPLADRP